MTNVDLWLYTDASHLSVAGVYKRAWLVELIKDTTHSISWREMYAVVIAVAKWLNH